MTPSLLLSHYELTQCLLTKFVNRTGFLDVIWAGAFTSEAVQQLQNPAIELTLVCMPPPGQVLDEDFLNVLRTQRMLLLTAQYPIHLYGHYGLHPKAFLEEPFSFNQFQVALERCLTD